MSNKAGVKKVKMATTPAPALVPRLRFPEFRGAGDWGIVKLKQLAKRVVARNVQEAVSRVLTNSAEYGVIDQRDYFDKDIANKSNLGGYYIVEEGDYVYNPRISEMAPVGPTSKNNIGTGVMSPLYTVFRFHNRDNGFYAHYFASSHWHRYLREVSNSGARHDRMAVSSGEFFDMPVPAPQEKEQQKITDCLSSLDEVITLESQKLEALKVHKKGLMQQLFPAEGETVPKLRFPEFRGAEGWEERQLGDLSRVVRGASPRPIQDHVTTDPDGLPWLRIGDVSDDAKYITKTEQRIRVDSIDKTREVHPNDLILSNSMSFGRPYILKISACIHDGWIAVSTIDRSVSSVYLYYFMLAAPSQSYFRDLAAGSGVQNLNSDIVKRLQVFVPDLPEQTRIVGCLSSLDEAITLESQKLDALKNHKYGLMQQLFPSAEV
jgi:type I restriction enzyme S subunit